MQANSLLPRQLSAGGSTSNGITVSLTYSDWNVPYVAVAPPAADTVELPAGY